MRTLKYILSLGLLCPLFMACNDDYLQKFPETSINEETFFQSPADLETYTNSLYGQLSYSYDDLFSDNIGCYTGTSELENLLRGRVTYENVGGWSKDTWGNLRRINLMLANVGRTQGDITEINHYVGIARYFRAQFYWGMIKRYGNAPWYSRPLKTTDTELLMKTQDPRTLVVDSIMADLKFAAENIKPIDSRTRLNQYAALQLLARFALFEGTYRKYHTELNLQSTADNFLKEAVAATEKIMTSDKFFITGKGAEGYRNLFSVGDLSGNKEIILFADYDLEQGRQNNTSSVLDWQWNMSRSLADSYLTLDGTPATSDPTYATKGFVEMFENRDPRMAETIMPAGFAKYGDTSPHLISPSFGGLPQLKFYPRTAALNGGYGKNNNDIPIFRYAETLLVNAEAKAELGTLTQADLDVTINLIRDRVSMPHLTMGVTLDPVLAKRYPQVTNSNKAVLLEIRRERRIELACEGLRWDDLKRWGAGDLIALPGEGIYVPGLGAIDVTGDGEPDIAILQSPSETGPIDGLAPEIKDKLVCYYLIKANGKPESFYLSEGTKGVIRFVKDKDTPREFISPKYYYFPIPKDQMIDNPNLKQPSGWE